MIEKFLQSDFRLTLVLVFVIALILLLSSTGKAQSLARGNPYESDASKGRGDLSGGPGLRIADPNQ